MNIDSKEKLEWMVTGGTAKHILLTHSDGIMKSIYWHQRSFYFDSCSTISTSIGFVIRILDEFERTFEFKISQNSKRKTSFKFNLFESIWYKFKSSANTNSSLWRHTTKKITIESENKKKNEKISMTFNSKPFGISLNEGMDGLNAKIRRIKKDNINFARNKHHSMMS